MMSQREDRQFSIHVAGALHIDEVATVQGTFVQQASNQVTWQRSVGGVGSNAARAAETVLSATERGIVCLHAAVGLDTAAKQLIETMQAQGLNVAAQQINDCSTGRYTAVISNSGELVLGLADVQLAEQLSAAPIVSTLEHNAMHALLLDANLSPDCLSELVNAAAELTIPLAAMTVSPSKALRLLPIARQIPLLFCNRREAMAMAIECGLIHDTSLDATLSLSRLMELLVDMGFNDCVLTDGGEPLIIRCQGKLSGLPVPPTTMMQNVNGAGDALAGASFTAMVAGCSLMEAVERYGLTQAKSVLGGNSLLTLNACL